MFDFGEFKNKITDLESWLQKELATIRTGRATPVILDSVLVEAYGAKMPIREIANVIVEDARSIKVEPWDVSLGKNIEKAITSSNLGLSLSPYDKGVRVIFPELTSDRREQLVKVVKQKLEEARITLRGYRDKTWNDIQAAEKQGGMGEDDKFRLKEEMQKLVDEANRKLDQMAEMKEKEIKS